MRSYIDLCGTWELVYTRQLPNSTSPVPSFEETCTMDAVPGYWEDMIPSLQMAPYWNLIKFNPDYRPLRYPMTGSVPDMVLPTIIGCFFYRKHLFIGSRYKDQSAFFYCGGVQNHMLLWINGKFVNEHFGYSTPFSFDITDFLTFDAENEIIFAVSNTDLYNEDGEVISGCTNRAANRFTGGVTDKIHIEFRNSDHISDMYISSYIPETDSFTVHTALHGNGNHMIRWEIYDANRQIRDGISKKPVFSVSRGNLALWSPKSPRLYRLKLTLLSDNLPVDTAELDIGIRKLHTKGYRLRLNGTPVYLRGICEHGYYAKTVHPDHDIHYYKKVIRILKQMDFNFIRFHTHIPMEEYMSAADELGILLHIESPNNTTAAQWEDIIRHVRRHPSVVIACCGNELLIDENRIEQLHKCADIAHALAPGILFSPMNALRGVEYYWQPSNFGSDIASEPFAHNPVRLSMLQEFSDLFSSYALGHLSYESTSGDPLLLDSFADTYMLPRISHEICLHGTYADLDLEWRYNGTRIGESELYSSVRKLISDAGLLHRAPLYYINSCKWQLLLRKHCFENTRLTSTLAGYDFLGDIDHHWHTFGYCVGIMNEFYELKPGETFENIRRYNGESVILTDLGTNRCFTENEPIRIQFLVSLFGGKDLKNATLDIRFETSDRKILSRHTFPVNAANGGLHPIALLETTAPETDTPRRLFICARISHEDYELENQWDIWVFPKTEAPAITTFGRLNIDNTSLICTDTLNEEVLTALNTGSDVLLIGTGELQSNPMSFQISLPGRTAGNLATVIEPHPLTNCFEHDGFCSWPFFHMMNDASCIYYSPETAVPFQPIIEIVSSYKWIRKQTALAELLVGKGRLLISTFNLSANGPAEKWWFSHLLHYMESSEFNPTVCITPDEFHTLFADGTSAAGINTNVAANANDITMK